MEVFNKICSQVSSSVSSTVSQLSGVLPGNPVTREFDATAHIASAGPGLLWKIYKGNKNSTKQPASIFVFEKRQLDKWNKSDREIILETLKKGIIQLTKIRHPQILTVQHPLEESRESLAFATEPVFASLANILGQTHNMPQPANMSEYKLFDIEIKYGLLQIGEGLAFLHNDVRLIHKNICPETIIINQTGAWKIFGLDFCSHNTNPPNISPCYPFEEYNITLPYVARPNMEYLAPECIMNQSHSPAIDMFSLGMVVFAIRSTGNHTIGQAKDIQQFKARVQQLKNLNMNKLQCLPEALQQYVKLMLNISPEVRPDAHQFTKISYFDDLGIKTLTYLDSLLQWDNLQRSQFYKGLPEALPNLPQRVKVQRVLSCLVRDLSQPAMIPFILPSILDIAQNCTQKEYCNYILPHLKPIMKMMDPIQILLTLLQRMQLLLKLTPSEDIQQHVLPMLYRGLDSDITQIHELCLSVLPTFAGLLEHSNVKNSLLPRVKKLCLSTSSLSVRVNCLLCVGRILEHLDKWLVLDDVLPFLPQIPSREPAVLMGILGIYKLALNHKKLGISKEIIATRILPFLIPLCIENGLTLTQFNALVGLVKEMLQTVENEHRIKLDQLNSVKDQAKILAANMPTIEAKKTDIVLDTAFSGLGLDSFVPQSNAPKVQEKQKLAQSHNTLNFFQNTISLEPVPVNISKPLPPKDSSPTLLNDFNPFDTSMSQTNNGNFKSNMNSIPIISPPQNYGVKNVNANNPGTTNITATVNTVINNQKSVQFSPMQNTNSNFNRNPYNFQTNQNFSNSMTWSNSQTTSYGKSTAGNSQGNWGTLDSLLPTTNKIPMNQMTVNQPLISSNNNTSDNKSKLSNKDIMDLLS